MTDDFGHHAYLVRSNVVITHIDAWGSGPFMFRIDGRRVFFEDSAMFGPAVLRISDWSPSDRQPGEKSRFWVAHRMWLKAGRPVRGRGRVRAAVWHEPTPGTYWKDEHGVSHILSNPDLDDGDYVCVPNPGGR